ncbi:MAG: MFS transporter [Thermomicrobiales bacterium]|nr:MFS transporter [Thermomicrobiales bacterium]
MSISLSEQEASDRNKLLALLIISLAQLMVVLDATIVNIALPTAQEDLGITDSQRQWVVTAYALSFGSLLLLGGRISDFWGRRKAFITGLAGFAVASAIGGAAPNPEVLFLARALQGVFGALLAPAALSQLAVIFVGPNERARAFGIYGAVSGAGSAVGLLLGGVLTEYLSWRWCLYVNIPIALFGIAMALIVLQESKATGSTQYDVPGAVLATTGLASLVYGFSRAEQDGWGAASTIGFLTLAVVLLVGFIIQEQRAAYPLLPLRILLDRNRAGAYLTMLGIGVAVFAMFFFLTFYMQQNLSYSPIRTGFAFLPFTVAIVITATSMGRLLPILGPRILMTAGPLLMAVGLFWMAQLGVASNYWTHIFGPAVIMAVGMGMLFISVTVTALSGLSANDSGVGSAMINTIQQIGGSLGVPLLSTIAATAAANYLASATPGPDTYLSAAVEGYTTAFLWASGIAVLVAIVAFVMISPRVSVAATGEGAPVMH